MAPAPTITPDSLCARCGYPLASPDARCSECGFAEHAAARQRGSRALRAGRLGWGVVVGLWVACFFLILGVSWPNRAESPLWALALVIYVPTGLVPLAAYFPWWAAARRPRPTSRTWMTFVRWWPWAVLGLVVAAFLLRRVGLL